MNLFGKKDNNKGAEESPKKVVSEKTKKSASLMSRSLSKLSKLFASKKTAEESSMSNSGYLGEIYKLLVESKQDAKTEQDEQQNFREEEDSEEQKRHTEIIKALTLRRKPKRVIKREKKAEETAKRKEEPAKPAEKPSATQKPVEKPVEKPKAPKAKEPVKEAPKKTTTKPAEPVKPAKPVKPPTATQKPPAIPKPAAPTATKIPKGMSSATGPIVGALAAAGITNVYAQRAILANVEKETGGDKMEENLLAYKGTSNERIRKIFTSRVQNLSDEQLNDAKKDPYKFGELVYGKNTKIGQSMGNTEEGDGYKYRGRGYIQLTGKNNYRDYSKSAGVDLVKNPDTLLQTDVSAKVTAEFIKRGRGSKGLEFNSQEEANRAVTQAIGGKKLNLDTGIGAELLSKVEKNSKNYSDIGTGSKIDQTSKENKDMKVQDQPAPMTENNNTTNIHTTNSSPTAKTVDDRPAHQRK